MSMYYPEQSQRFAAWLKSMQGRSLVVVSHARPDGDSIGSLVAMTRLLRVAGVNAVAVNPDRVPRVLRFLLEGTEVFENGDIPAGRDGAVLVDCADRLRIGKDLAEKLPVLVGNIDHHVSNKGFAELDLVVSDAAATCEILAGLALDVGLEIDVHTADALYAGILTDTGQFAYGNTTPRSFELAEILCRKGVNTASVASQLYENETFERIRLMARFLSRLQLYENGKICMGYVTQLDYDETGTASEDAEGFSSYTRSLQGVELGVFLESKPEGIKGSFRTRTPAIRADLLAARFNGGGHASAAGFYVTGHTIETLWQEILVAAKDWIAS
jgi:phosphoesterase RecJ-like protein